MKLRTLVALATLAVAAVMAVMTLAGSPTKAAPATCTVPGTHPTIQAAAADASCTVINVAPGIYNENVLVSNPTTINGAQAGNNDFVTRSANPAGESIVNGVTP